MRTQKARGLTALFLAALFVFSSFALSHTADPASRFDQGYGTFHGELAAIEPPAIHRSEMFTRLGSVAINITSCLHDTSTDVTKSFTCTHDYFDQAVAHGNGDHFGNMFRQFDAWFQRRFANDADYFLSHGVHDWEVLKELMLGAHGITETTVVNVCKGKRQPLEDATDLPGGITAGDVWSMILASRICAYVPFYYDDTWDANWEWGQHDYHDGHHHPEDPGHEGEHEHDEHGPIPAGGRAASPVLQGTGDAVSAGAGHGHSDHGGPHGVDFNSELNWVYAAQSHQKQIAVVNLNVIDWGKVAAHEEETGYRVLLFDEESVFTPEAVLYYASNLLLENQGNEAALLRSLDTIHRYCFDANKRILDQKHGSSNPSWSDDLTAPDPALADALAYIRARTNVPTVSSPPPNESGWACFLAFTGIDARPWTDPAFSNPFCTFDTRHLARYDHMHSSGIYSRFNPYRLGDGDAWRCDWFVRYLHVSTDLMVRIRRAVPIGAGHDFATFIPGHTPQQTFIADDGTLVPKNPEANIEVPDLVGKEWVEFMVPVSIGPHDLAYNPVNSLIYVTHYWLSDDPDIRQLADWTIHIVNGNPATPTFNNPYDTRATPAALSCHAYAWMEPGKCFRDYSNLTVEHDSLPSYMRSRAYPMDVGGPLDGLHPVTVDVDVRDGSVFVVNRESNTVSRIRHTGSFEFSTDRLGVTLSGAPQIGYRWDPGKMRAMPRAFDLYSDPESLALPSPGQIAGRFDVDLNHAKDDCARHVPLNESDLESVANAAHARLLCERGLMTTTGIDHAELADKVRPYAEGLVRRVLETNSPWLLLLADLREVLARDAASFPTASRGFLDEWLARLTSHEDRRFLNDGLLALQAVAPEHRDRARAVFFAQADARLPGHAAALIDDLVAMADDPLADFGLSAAFTYDVVSRWGDAARDGSLLGIEGASLSIQDLQVIVEAMEPAIMTGLVTGPWWLQYCLTFSIDDWVHHLKQGENPYEARGKEEENGLHPFHCDDVYPIHYPGATPIQFDFAGISNHHAVTIIREPIGPLLLDYWYETRPRLLQPFDTWINPGDGQLYVSNLGNHDNVPIVDGWISILQPGEPRCHMEKEKGLLGGISPVETPVVRVPKLSCTIPLPPGGAQANLLIPMGIKPHHINVNPYTFEVYGGHMGSDYIMAAQFEGQRIDWAIPKQTIIGSGAIEDGGGVPLTKPTGMGVNPSSQRLFMTHFLDASMPYVPLTGRIEDLSRYVGAVDLRNYSLMPDLVFGGDHHVSVDMTRPATFEDPFYNRLVDLNVAGERRVGNKVLVGETSNNLNLFWRCTYYRLAFNPATERLEDGVVNVRLEHKLAVEVADQGFEPFRFTSGRCFNLFDLNPQMPRSAPITIEENGARIFEDNPFVLENGTLAANVFWEFGAEKLSFGILNLFLDPDNVPANLRVIAPHSRDGTRAFATVVQATEELASVWAEIDTPGRAAIPQGELVFELPQGIDLSDLALDRNAGERGFDLAFDTNWIVEWNGPLRTPPARFDNLVVLVTRTAENATRTVEVANWSAETFAGPAWVESRIALAPVADGEGEAVVTIRFDSVDEHENDRRGWAIGGLSIVEDAHARCPYDGAAALCAPDPARLGGFSANGLVSEVPMQGPTGSVRQALAFQDPSTRSYDTGGRSQGEFSFTIHLDSDTDPEIVLLHRPDVENIVRDWRPGKPYDAMTVEASSDGGVTWRAVWKKDSRDAPQPQAIHERRDVTPFTTFASGAWASFSGAAIEAERPLVRLRFDALDPAFNQFPGWQVANLSLVTRGGVIERAIDLVPVDLAVGPGLSPVWHATGPHAYAFRNVFGTYETNLGAGGAQGLVCRLDHVRFGTWSGGLLRGPGSGALTFCGLDLAGHVTTLTHRDGRGIALVEDSFQSAGFTENYWKREEFDPHGVGYAAYVYDPSPDGMGTLVPKDSPVQFRHASVSAALTHGPGEIASTSRTLLVEGPPANEFFEYGPLNTEVTALVGDREMHRRAFLLMPADADKERLPEDAARILDQEDGWLNGTHVRLLRPPEPVKTTINELERSLASQNPMGGDMKNRQIDLAKIVRETTDAGKLLLSGALGNFYGLRDPPVDRYVLDGVRDYPVLAGERLVHEFPFSRTASEPTSLDFSLDVMVRHRMEEYVVHAKPGLPRLDLELLAFILHNVTLDRFGATKAELEDMVGPIGVTEELYGDASWLATTTLADLGKRLEDVNDVAGRVGRGVLSVRVPVSEILNDLDRFQISLPSHGEAYSVNATLKGPDGVTHILALRDGVFTNPADFRVDPPRGDVRITLDAQDTAGAFDVRLGWDFGRFEKLRLHLGAETARSVLPASGTYELAIESWIRGGDVPVPGLFYEIAYADLFLGVTTTPVGEGNEPPNAAFAWHGPVQVGSTVTLAPGRRTAALADLEDQDGFVRRYEWRLPATAVSAVSLEGRILVDDADASAADDLRIGSPSNALATRYGKLAQRLTNTIEGDERVIRYDAFGCTIPVIDVRFHKSGAYPVTLTVEDDGGARATLTQTIRITNGATRPPEIIADPIETPEGTALWWQRNTGSLFLESEGRSLNLTRFLGDSTATLDELRNETKLLESLDGALLLEDGEASLAEVAVATKSGAELLQAVYDGAATLPDVLLDTLLLRPGTVRVTTSEPQDATAGTRLHILLGEMPPSKLAEITDAAEGLVGFENRPSSVRASQLRPAERAQFQADVESLCENPESAESLELCDADLDDVLRLLFEGVLDAWIFRYSLHPDVGGVPDLERTLAQVIVADTGVSLLYFAILEGIDEVIRIPGELVPKPPSDLDGLDPASPAVALLGIADAVANESGFTAKTIGSILALDGYAHSPSMLLANPVQYAQKLADAVLDLGLDAANLEASVARLDAMRAANVERTSEALAFLVEAEAAADADTGRVDANAWAAGANAYTGMSVDPAEMRRASLKAGARANFAEARAAALEAETRTRAAIDALSAATNVTLLWADDWIVALESGDPALLVQHLEAGILDAEDAFRDVEENATRVYSRVIRAVRPILDALLAPPPTLGPRDGLLLGLAYDASTGKASVRAGDRILAEGIVAGERYAAVHASMSMSSIGRRTAEVQAFWTGQGSTLYDSFNRGSDSADEDRWTTDILGKPRTNGKADTRIVDASGDDGAHQLVWVTRSAEGRLAKKGENPLLGSAVDTVSPATAALIDLGPFGEQVNRHRFAADARGSPPEARAATQVDTAVATPASRTIPAPPQIAVLADDPGDLYGATLRIPTGAIQELRVADSAARQVSAPAVHVVRDVPPPPHVFSVRSFTDAEGTERLHIAFQAQGIANPAIDYYDVYAAPRPDTTPATGPGVKVHLGRVHTNPVQALVIDPTLNENGWRPGTDYFVLDTVIADPALHADWRYIVVRGHNAIGDGPFGTPYRVPPTLLDEDFSTLRQGPLHATPGMRVDVGSGDIVLPMPGLPALRIDTCFGDRVDVTRQMNFPHDEIAARWARSLRVKESGIDGLLSLLSQTGAPLSALPIDLGFLDVPISSIDLELCPSLRSLLGDLAGVDVDSTTILEHLEISPGSPAHVDYGPIVDHVTHGRIVDAWANLTRLLLGNVSLDLNVGDLLHGTPASVTWRTEEVTGAYHARVRFLVPNPLKLPDLHADQNLEGLVPTTQLGLLSALVSTERFHLLELGYDDGENFTSVLHVDLDPHLLAPADPEQTLRWAEAMATLQKDPVGALATFDLPLVYGIRAGDGPTGQRHVGNAKLEHWHTLEVYASDAAATVYSVYLDGHAVGQFRTAKPLAPNALRIGGTNVAAEVFVDDVRFMNAIHPPAPVIRLARAEENFDFATVRWYVPENGGSPLTDFNLFRIDLDEAELRGEGGAARVVTTASSGALRVLVDPESADQPVGQRYAYAVQAVNGLRGAQRNTGPLSDARGVVLPGFLRVSGDAAIAHIHEVPNADVNRFDGQALLATGGGPGAIWRSVYKVNASDVTDARGRALDRSALGSATFMVYAIGTGAPTSERSSLLPLPSAAEIRRITGLPKDVQTGALLGDCPDLVPALLLQGRECTPTTPEPINFVGMCDDYSRDLEIAQIPFNCWEDAIAAFVSSSTAFDTRTLDWSTQPRTEYWLNDDGIGRQATRDEAWRRYEILPAILRDADGDGDVAITLKKEGEKTFSALVQYAASEAASWLGDRLGLPGGGPRSSSPFVDGAGPETFPWTKDAVHSGERAIRLGDQAGVSSVQFAPTGAVTVPFDVPIKVRVLIPEDASPREIGMRISATITTRSGSTADRTCGVYGWNGGTALVTWGENVVRLVDGELVIDTVGGLDHNADLLSPRESYTGYHVGGIPTARGKWVTLTFDPGQLALELWGQRVPDKGLVDLLFDTLARLRGPDTSTFVPEHLANQAAIYERTRPTAFEERVDSVFVEDRDVIDFEPPYFYHIPPWLFFFQGYDAYIEPRHCGLRVHSVELFTVDGTVYVDDVGPDIAPRVRLDAGGDPR